MNKCLRHWVENCTECRQSLPLTIDPRVEERIASLESRLAAERATSDLYLERAARQKAERELELAHVGREMVTASWEREIAEHAKAREKVARFQGAYETEKSECGKAIARHVIDNELADALVKRLIESWRARGITGAFAICAEQLEDEFEDLQRARAEQGE